MIKNWKEKEHKSWLKELLGKNYTFAEIKRYPRSLENEEQRKFGHYKENIKAYRINNKNIA